MHAAVAQSMLGLIADWDEDDETRTVDVRLLRMSEPIIINPESVQETVALLHQNPVLLGIRNIVRNTILRDPIVIRETTQLWKGSKQKLFEKFIAARYAEFCSKALLYAMAVGFVGWTWVEDEDFIGYPVCLSLEQVLCVMKYNCVGRYEMDYQPLNGSTMSQMFGNVMGRNQDDTRALKPKRITTTFYSEPSTRGQIRSIVSSLLDDRKLEDFIRQCFKDAQAYRSRPVTYISKKETRPDPNVGHEQAVSDVFDTWCPNPQETLLDQKGSTRQQTAGPQMNTMTMTELEQRRLIEVETQAKNRGFDPDEAKRRYLGMPSSRGMPVEPLPVGFSIDKHPPLPEAPSFITYSNDFEERTAIAFGVPRTLWTNKSLVRQSKKTHSSGDDSAERIFAYTITSWKTWLGRLLSHCYEQIYSMEHFLLQNLERRGLIKKRKSKAKPLTREKTDTSADVKEGAVAASNAAEDDDDSNNNKQLVVFNASAAAYAELSHPLIATHKRPAKVENGPKVRKKKKTKKKKKTDSDSDSATESDSDSENHESIRFTHRISAEFLFPSTIDFSSVDFMYTRGFMEDETYSLYCSREFGVPEDDLLKISRVTEAKIEAEKAAKVSQKLNQQQQQLSIQQQKQEQEQGKDEKKKSPTSEQKAKPKPKPKPKSKAKETATDSDDEDEESSSGDKKRKGKKRKAQPPPPSTGSGKAATPHTSDMMRATTNASRSSASPYDTVLRARHEDDGDEDEDSYAKRLKTGPQAWRRRSQNK